MRGIKTTMSVKLQQTNKPKTGSMTLNPINFDSFGKIEQNRIRHADVVK